MKNFLFVLLLLPLISTSQVKPLFIEGTSPDLYLVHTTAPKETFYSVGRVYNISPKVMAPYNRIELEKGLSIGQVVRIPLNEINFSQDGTVGADEVLVPLYHKVKPKETLYNISITNNKIPVDLLKKWNRLSSDAVPNGINMIVGYLRVKKELSPLAGNAVKVESPVRIEPVDMKTATINQEREEPIAKKPEPVKEKPAEKPLVKEEKKQTPAPVSTAPLKQVISKGRNFEGGSFKSLFRKQAGELVEEKGVAGTFKSTSGWEDGKYYCLHNTAKQGTIIKITNPVNNQVVYAKVLDLIPDIRQNEGMIIRLSNAAAAELGVITENFECTLHF